jgi:hypothetical protein
MEMMDKCPLLFHLDTHLLLLPEINTSGDRFFLSVFCLDDRPSSEKAIVVTRQLAKNTVIMSLQYRRSNLSRHAVTQNEVIISHSCVP